LADRRDRIWDGESLDLDEPAVITIDGAGGDLRLVAIDATLDIRYDARNGAPIADSASQASTRTSRSPAAAGCRPALPAGSSATFSATSATIPLLSASPGDAPALEVLCVRHHIRYTHLTWRP
jgi:hypothetical protein